MRWTWPGEDPPYSPAPSVTIDGNRLIWDVEVDHDSKRPGDHTEQSFEDFLTYGPAWLSAPKDVIDQLLAQPGLENPRWLQPGFDPYSKAWHAIETVDEAAALAAAATEDPRREYRYRTTLLMHAAVHGATLVVEHLLNAGAEVNARDELGQSALVKTLRGYHASLQVVRLLVEHHADQLDQAARFAMASDSEEIAEYLLQRGAEVTDQGYFFFAAKKGWTNVLRILLARGIDPNCCKPDGGTLLTWAGSRETVELLASAGADLNRKVRSGDTALSLACATGMAWKVEALLKAGAEPNVPAFHGSFGALRGQPAFHCLLQLGRSPEIVEMLRAAGAR